MNNNINEIELIYPDDWHCHLRDGIFLERTVFDAATHFKRVIVMPNLVPPVKTARDAKEYHDRIIKHVPKGVDFTPLMVLYLTDETSPKIITDAKNSGIVVGCKLYPAGATTNSQSGVTSIDKLDKTFAAMAECGLPLLIHGETTHADTDIFDREKEFIDTHLVAIIAKFPTLKIVLEHITTRDAVDFIKAGPKTLAATITPHHLLLNRNDLLVNAIKPHHYCLPILKRKAHQEALIQAATSGNPKFFIGTDSAPHAQNKKETGCGCAGIYNAQTGITVYAQVFEQAGALSKLENFTSRFGPDFYGLPYNQVKCKLVKTPWVVPHSVEYGEEKLIPFLAGETLTWSQI